jgi:hypothetical protein
MGNYNILIVHFDGSTNVFHETSAESAKSLMYGLAHAENSQVAYAQVNKPGKPRSAYFHAGE